MVIETVFALPGIGRYFVQGALNRDYPLVLGVVILYAALIVLFKHRDNIERLFAGTEPRIGRSNRQPGG